MIRAFWKSKLAVGAVMVVCLGLAVAVWLRDREYPVYIPAIASLLLLGIGYFAGRLLGNLVAGTQIKRGNFRMERLPWKKGYNGCTDSFSPILQNTISSRRGRASFRGPGAS